MLDGINEATERKICVTKNLTINCFKVSYPFREMTFTRAYFLPMVCPLFFNTNITSYKKTAMIAII